MIKAVFICALSILVCCTSPSSSDEDGQSVQVILCKGSNTGCHNGPTTFSVDDRICCILSQGETDTITCFAGDAVRAKWTNTCGDGNRIQDTTASDGLIWKP